MSTTIVLLGIALAFLVGLLFPRRTGQSEAKIFDLTAKIKEQQNQAAQKQADADQKTKEYFDARKEYDPDFHNNDDGDGKPSA